MSLRIIPLKFQSIKDTAIYFLKTYNISRDTIPIPIENITDQAGIDITPHPFLKRDYNVDAYISNDLKTIYIDQDIYYRVETRFRFSVAHELGHYFLHHDIYKQLKFSNHTEWLKVQKNLDADRELFESQAVLFASFVLIPDYLLDKYFPNELSKMTNKIKEAKKEGLQKNFYIESVMYQIALKIAPHFNVSANCMKNRLLKDRTYFDEVI